MDEMQVDGSKIVDSGRRPSGDYAALQGVLDEAYRQSAEGKGNARHANDKPFTEQPILEIGRMVGPGFAAGQVMKKAQEAIGMASRGETEAAANELLGAIVYAASAVVLVREAREPARNTRKYTVGALGEITEIDPRTMKPLDASRLIEPEVAATAREFGVGDRVLNKDVPEAGVGVITSKLIKGWCRVRYEAAAFGDCADHQDSLIHVD
ncbi:MAG TPA: hypothetical protein VIU82_00300 [Bosea sp. (in: a-proteobacteria)]